MFKEYNKSMIVLPSSTLQQAVCHLANTYSRASVETRRQTVTLITQTFLIILDLKSSSNSQGKKGVRDMGLLGRKRKQTEILSYVQHPHLNKNRLLASLCFSAAPSPSPCLPASWFPALKMTSTFLGSVFLSS